MTRDALVLANLENVRSIAVRLMRRLPPCVEVEDVVADGVIGLIEAATTFDENRGIPFWAFAYRRVRGAMVDGLRHDQGRRKYQADRPLVAPWPEEFDVMDKALSPEARLLAEDRDQRVRQAIRELPRRESVVLGLVARGRSLREAAAHLGVCESRASQLKLRAIRRLRAVYAA